MNRGSVSDDTVCTDVGRVLVSLWVMTEVGASPRPPARTADCRKERKLICVKVPGDVKVAERLGFIIFDRHTLIENNYMYLQLFTNFFATTMSPVILVKVQLLI